MNDACGMTVSGIRRQNNHDDEQPKDGVCWQKPSQHLKGPVLNAAELGLLLSTERDESTLCGGQLHDVVCLVEALALLSNRGRNDT